MKKLILLILVLCSSLVSAQDEFPSKWEYRFRENIYHRAFKFYLEETGQADFNGLNVDYEKPKIGIYLIKSEMDTTANLEKLMIRFCLDDSWKDGRYDSFSFFGTTLLLIDSEGQDDIPNEKWEELVQDRVYVRKPAEERLFPTFIEQPRTSIKLEKANYDKREQICSSSLGMYRANAFKNFLNTNRG